jgi:hypothetical protein
MASNADITRLLRAIPPKWAVGIIAVVLGYWLLQPVVNRTFGWHLPSIASMLGEGESGNKSASQSKSPAGHDADIGKSKSSSPSEDRPDRKQPEKKSKTGQEKLKSRAKSSEVGSSAEIQAESSSFLRTIGRDRYESPAGLIYGPGSEEGHRLKHLARHLDDIENRPGSHGVFEGTMDEFLVLIDDAYLRAKKKQKGTKQRDEEGMTVMEVSFEKKIGYIGGTEGKRKGNPPSKRLRLVLQDERVITAFPF